MELEVKKYNNLKTQADAVLCFLQSLDIDMVSAVLEENRTYQDFEKHVFIQKLDYTLDEFIHAGDTYLNRYDGFCNAETCNYKCKGFTFIGNNSGHYFDLIIDIKDGVVLDIYECTLFKCLENGLSKNNRIEIDKSSFPF
ncbi:MAG: hypothetical protein SGJ00_10865 [bacterium]|nr:hypothetical protein [bacterium]